MSPSLGSVSCLSGRCFKFSKWIYDLWSMSFSLCLCWFLGWWNLCMSTLGVVFHFVQLYSFLECNPHWFSNLKYTGGLFGGLFWGLVSPLQDLMLGVSQTWIPCSSKKSFIPLILFPTVTHCRWDFFPLVGLCPCLSFLSRCHFFYSLLWRLCSFNFQVLFRGTYSIGSCRFVVSMGRGELTILLCHHLESNLSFLYVLYNSFSVILSQQWFISLAVC